jgi:hypothetical protein
MNTIAGRQLAPLRVDTQLLRWLPKFGSVRVSGLIFMEMAGIIQ